MDFDPASLSPLDRYKLLTGLVVPRPIALVSTLDSEGARNLAPFSFFNMFSASPPVVVLGINMRGGTHKDSFANIVATGEFVVSVATAALAEQLNAASADVGSDVDEFTLAGLSAVPSATVKPPRVGESPAHLECRLSQTVPLGGDRALILGEIVHVHVRDHLLDGVKVDQAGLDAIGRMGGPLYSYTRETFAMERPAPSPPAAAKVSGR